MSRILLLVLCLIWMAGPPGTAPPAELVPNLTLFLGFYLFMVLMLGFWSRGLARRMASRGFQRRLRRFNNVMFWARVAVPVWFTVGVWGLGWGAWIGQWGVEKYHSVFGMLLGTLPAFLAWMGLWWSQYPAERALREQNLLIDLDSDSPIYRPPDFGTYCYSNFRLQILFTLVPVALIVLIRDVLYFGTTWLAGADKPAGLDMGAHLGSTGTDWPAIIRTHQALLDMGAHLGSAGIVLLFSPALLRRVLNTHQMPDGPLRRRLEAMCKTAGVRYRRILVWNTNNHVGNAAVMGMVPWLRYVLLSDVLLERMSDEEIEAVFAHELGHVVHRHMTWYIIYFGMIVLLWAALYAAIPHLGQLNQQPQILQGLIIAGLPISMLLGFGALSRRCERQADVYAARTMELLHARQPVASEGLFAPRQLATVGAGPIVPDRAPRHSHVGRYGASVFASALRRVASINNIPITPIAAPESGFRNHIAYYFECLMDLANNWLHGSIAGRMQYLQNLSADPRLTSHFDRTMFWLYCSLLFTLFWSAFATMASGALSQ